MWSITALLCTTPPTPEEWDFVINHIVQKGDRVEDWVGLMDAIRGDPVIGGSRLSEMTQIEGSTGNFARTPYGSYALFHNNPQYREVYFQYLEELYTLGIDGIMNDRTGTKPSLRAGAFYYWKHTHCAGIPAGYRHSSIALF